jgi:hypothetical protein
MAGFYLPQGWKDVAPYIGAARGAAASQKA